MQWTETPRLVLEGAIAQHSHCQLTLPKVIGGFKELDCDILQVSERGMVLECLDKVVSGPHWVDLPVTGFFRLMLRREELLKEMFFTFSTCIQRTATGPNGLLRLRLNEPAALDVGQRRKSMRLKPERDGLRSIFLWRYDRASGFDREHPALRSSDFTRGEVLLVNLSAGGLCLHLRAALARERNLPTERGDKLVLHLELHEPRATTTGEFLLATRVNHCLLDRVSQHLSLGLEFLAEGVPDSASGKMRWRPIEGNVIPRLADILYVWHLDHREKRLV